MEITGNVSLDTAYYNIYKGSLWVMRVVQYTVYNSMSPPLQSQYVCIVCSARRTTDKKAGSSKCPEKHSELTF